MIKLYHNDMSTCAQKVRFVLATKGLDWEGKLLDLRRGDQQQPDFLKINPKGLVPALVHNDHVIVESNVIVDYLNEAFPEPPLLPDAPIDRAKVRWWIKRLDDGLHLDVAALSFGIAFRHQLIKVKGSDEAVIEHIEAVPDPYLREVERQVVFEGTESPRFIVAVKQFEKLIKEIDTELQTHAWICGDQLTLADIAFAPYVTRLEHLNMQGLWQDRLKFSDWYQRLKKTEGYQAGLAEWFNHDFLALMQEKGKEAWPRVVEILNS